MFFTQTEVKIILFYFILFYFIMCGFIGNYFMNDCDLTGTQKYFKYTIPNPHPLKSYRGLRPHRGSRRSPPLL